MAFRALEAYALLRVDVSPREDTEGHEQAVWGPCDRAVCVGPSPSPVLSARRALGLQFRPDRVGRMERRSRALPSEKGSLATLQQVQLASWPQSWSTVSTESRVKPDTGGLEQSSRDPVDVSNPTSQLDPWRR